LILHGRQNQSAVEKIILLLATVFRNENASVAGRAVQEAAFMAAGRIVLGADRVI
jgi:hypothetical protein